MKPNLLSAVRRILRALLSCGALSLALTPTIEAQVALDPYLARLPVEQRNSRAPVFPQPLVYIGEQAPDLKESQDLWSAIDVMRQNGPHVGIPALELFVQTYPNSVWTPSLRNSLGRYYRETGRYSLALEHWATVWDQTQFAAFGADKQVADFALAHLTRLLASLGRKEVLTEIFQQTRGRVLDAGPLQQMFDATREAFGVMRSEPGVAYRCGTLALGRVARILQPGSINAFLPLTVPSPESGFSMSALQDQATQLGLGLVAVQRQSGQELVVPSVVHWKLDHYAAITAFDGKRYKVEDPTFEQPVWMEPETLNAEASGYFLVPSNRLLPGWVVLSRTDSDQVFGRGYPYTMADSQSETCDNDEDGEDGADSTNPVTGMDPGNPASTCSTCNGSGGPPDDPPNDAGCSSCSDTKAGMPVWKVIEPFIQLWILDKPMIYTKSYGRRQSFRVMYKQRNTRSNPYGFGFGPSWECNRLSYVHADSGGNLVHYVQGGGERTYSGSQPEYKSGGYMGVTTDGSGSVVSVGVSLPSAAHSQYDYELSYYDGSKDLWLSYQVDRYAHTNWFNYTNVSGVVHLVSVQDHDGRSTTFGYGSGSYPDQITVATNPWGHIVHLNYDSSGRLTNIVDAAGISSSFVYDTTTGWVTNLVTPYGTTVFEPTGTSDDFQYEGYAVNRSCTVTEPDGSKQLFIYRRNAARLNNTETGIYTELIPSEWPAAEVPSLPYSNTVNTNYPQYSDTFYWNRKQYAALNSTFRSSGDFDDLTVVDYGLARFRHWLADQADAYLTGTLSVQREPSPDGSTAGQTTWYDYAGKASSIDFVEGTNSRPSTIARVLPNGDTHYVYAEYNEYFLPTLRVESYGDGSTSRTNNFHYGTNSIDLAYETGPNAETLRGYSYTNHHVLSYTNAVSDVTTYHYDAQLQLDRRVLPGGLTNSLTYGGDGFASDMSEDPISGSRSYTYQDSFVRSYTDDRGLAVTNYWDDLQRLTGILYPDNTTLSNIYTDLDITATKDRLGNWTYYGYDALRHRIAMTNANNVVTRYGYCDCGDLLYVTNAFGTAVEEYTSFVYDNQGNRTIIYFPDLTSVTNQYDSLKRLTNRLDALGSTTYWYNNQGLLSAVSNDVGQVSATVYDNEDRPVYVTDANGVTVTNTYDNLGRLLTRTYPDTGHEDFGYTATVFTSYTNQVGNVWTYAYDAASRKTNEIGVGVYTNSFTYNAAGDLLTLTDGKGQVTSWNYDEYGRVTNKVDQASVEILRYTYDADGRLASRWSKAMNTTYYTNDAVGNLTYVNYPSSHDITYQYDANNRLTNMVDAAGTNKFTYYAGGLLATEDGPFSNDTVTNIYNDARLRKALVLQQPTGTWTNGFTYDAAHRLSTVTSSAGTFTYTYETPGALVKKLALPNTSYITNTYDSVARLTGTYLDNSSNTVLDQSEYLYNAANQRIRLTRADSSYYTNHYDAIGQLVWADSTVASEDRGYVYDAAWNLNKRTNNTSPTTFSVDSKNQLSSVGGLSCGYDNNGNLTSYQYLHNMSGYGYYYYTYDDENQLTQVATDTSVTPTGSRWRSDFVYDGLGRLRQENDYVWLVGTGWYANGGSSYVYDGRRVIQQRSGSILQVAYTWGSDLSGSFEGAGGIGGLLSRSHAYQSGSGAFTNHNYYHADGGGNITYMVDTNQSMVASYRYDPFGNTISSSGTLASANLYRFSTKMIHANSTLYYYGYRWYYPNFQRWLNRDPIEEAGGINLYAFVENTPTTSYDLDGHLLEPAIKNLCECGFHISDTMYAAEHRAEELTGTRHSMAGSPADALTHCIGACQLAKDPGPCAEFGATDPLEYLKRREDIWTLEGRMDYLNNNAGANIASTGSDCEQGCINAFLHSGLYTIDYVKKRVTRFPPLAPPHFPLLSVPEPIFRLP